MKMKTLEKADMECPKCEVKPFRFDLLKNYENKMIRIKCHNCKNEMLIAVVTPKQNLEVKKKK